MSDDTDIRRALQRIQAPDELDAQRRAWSLTRAAFEHREPLSWQRRNRGPLLAAAAAAVLLVAVISPPGRALVGSVRDAVTDEKVTTSPALTSLPARGTLLVNSKNGPGWCGWTVPSGGSGLVGRLLVTERRVRRRHAPARGRGTRPRGSRAVVDRPDGHRARRALVVRGQSPRHARRLPQRASAASRRRQRHRRQGASPARRGLSAGLARRRPSSSRSRRSTAASSSSTQSRAGRSGEPSPVKYRRQLAWSEDGERLLAAR